MLGRGANDEKVYHWLRMGAGVKGYIGFAIGRTLWWDQLTGYLDGSLNRDAAVSQIAANYRKAIDIYQAAV